MNEGDSSAIINGGLPKDIPNNTIYYWTTESVERINESLSIKFECRDSNDTQLELVDNVIKDNIGIITMSGDISLFVLPFLSHITDLLDVRYIQLPKSCIGGVGLCYGTNLHELYIDNQITEADTIYLFPYVAYAPNLHIIKVDKYNPKYDSRNNCNALIDTETNTLMVGCQNTIIPNTVTSIGYGAFVGNTNLYTIDIPDSVNNISSYAFGSCGLTSITLPINITIATKAFENCPNLTEFNYKGTIEQWNNVTKGSEWHLGIPATVVHCTDGNVEIQ